LIFRHAGCEHPVVFQLSVMPRGPKGEKRPADVIGNVLQVMRIAAGEIEAQQVLELGEDLLNGVEIRAVRREEEEPCAGGSDHIANGLALVRAEVVEDHDIPRLQSCDQYFFDIKTEALGVDRAVEDPWRVDGL
jgi:hypothetical protein